MGSCSTEKRRERSLKNTKIPGKPGELAKAELLLLDEAMAGLRLLPAAMIFIHGAARVGSGGVAPFGEFLKSEIALWRPIVKQSGARVD